MYKHSLGQIYRSFLVLISIVILILFITSTLPYVYPFVIAVIIAFIIHPIVSFLEQSLKFPRTFATIIVMFFVASLLVMLSFLLISEMVQGTAYLADRIPTYYQSFIAILEDRFKESIIPIYNKLATIFQSLNQTQQEALLENLQNLSGDLASSGTALLQDFFLKIPVFLSLLPASLTIIIFIILATFFITKDMEQWKKRIKKVIPTNSSKYYHALPTHFREAFAGYFKAQLLLILITAGIIFIGLSLLQVKHTPTITFFAAIADFLPLIGTGILFFPWILYTFLTNHYDMTIGLCILYMIIVIFRQILEPKILSSHIGVNPLVGLMILFVGIQLWGVTGIIIAPFLLIIVTVIYKAGIFTLLWAFIKGEAK
ncbi:MULTISPECIES: sporulation integral membrane protein YtvI [unclassified Virgibacillus]|uniref:sporulation integral membrane protein YtvI n=1 Tax=unclassified Virgibacillus TaxID=2620237 RepID=UPI0024DE3451|nr:sporulation integral membrane protein YtvI [Virgibacillus sp. LDC-1]